MMKITRPKGISCSMTVCDLVSFFHICEQYEGQTSLLYRRGEEGVRKIRDQT